MSDERAGKNGVRGGAATVQRGSTVDCTDEQTVWRLPGGGKCGGRMPRRID